MGLYFAVVILAGLKGISICAQVFNQPFIVGLDGVLLDPRMVPVIDLETDKNTKYNHQQLDYDSSPILIVDVIAQTAWQHISSFSFM